MSHWGDRHLDVIRQQIKTQLMAASIGIATQQAQCMNKSDKHNDDIMIICSGDVNDVIALLMMLSTVLTQSL